MQKSQSKKEKTILVTGGAGYIGSHTVAALVDNGYKPIIVDNFSNSEPSVIQRLSKITGKEIDCYRGDCNDFALMQSVFDHNHIDGIIHFAAYKAVGESVEKPRKYYKNNLNSLLVLLDLMEMFSVKDIVFSSSCTVYGQPDELPVTEQTPRQEAASPYGNTKRICEDILHDSVKSGQALRVISLRYFNPIGAHPSAEIGELPLGVPANLVPFVTQTAAGIRNSLTVFGNDYQTADGTCIRDYIHVVDLAEAHVKAFAYLDDKEALFYDVFNVGTGNGNSVLEVIHTFEKETNQKLNFTFGERRPGDIEQIWAETTKVTDQMGWSAKLSLADAMRDAWNWQLRLLQNKNNQA